MFNCYSLNLDEEKALDFEDILKKAYHFIESRTQMVELATTNTKNNRMSDLVNKLVKKAGLEQPFSGFFTFSDSVFQAPVVFSVFLISVAYLQTNKKIDDLTDMMQSLALLVQTLQSNTGTTPTAPQHEYFSVNTSSKPRVQTNSQGAFPEKRWPEGVKKCMYCWQSDYYLKRHCQAFQDNLHFSQIH